MKIDFINSGTQVSVVRTAEGQVTDKLRPSIYEVGFNPQSGFFLTEVKTSFNIPKKVYGKATRQAEKVIRKYRESDNSVGALFTGDKGSGKTMLVEKISQDMLDQGYPIVMVNSAFTNSNFMDFINMLGEVVVIFDEFAKVYEDDAQKELLTLFSGVYSSKRLILLTENNSRNVNEFFMSRPSRIYYHFTFDKIDLDVVMEYSEEKGLPEDKVKDLVKVYTNMFSFSFDMLQSVVEECLRYPETSVADNIEDMNITYIKPVQRKMEVLGILNKETDEWIDLELMVNEKVVEVDDDEEIYIEFWKNSEDKKGDTEDKENTVEFYVNLHRRNLVAEKNGVMLFSRGGWSVKVLEKSVTETDYTKYLV